MKKLSLLAIVAAVLAACGDSKPTPEDFATVEAEISNASASGTALSISAVGPAGDYLIPLDQTEALMAVAAKAKTVTFLSVENPSQYFVEGKCLLNVIPTVTMEAMNTPENTCNFRLFCGSAEDLGTEAYAVELCSK